MSKMLYSITVEDVQNVANEEISRALTDGEIELVADKLGDHIGWYEAIALTIADVIENDMGDDN
ncbi:MAG: hypothetical protein AB7U82_12320 [Blastocatellales bacterium]